VQISGCDRDEENGCPAWVGKPGQEKEITGEIFNCFRELNLTLHGKIPHKVISEDDMPLNSIPLVLC
jgi:hypothetical protein